MLTLDQWSSVLPLEKGEQVVAVAEARGGDIGRSLSVTTDRRRLFVKYREDMPGELFKREAEGLGLLGAADALAVPAALSAGDLPGPSSGGMIVLEWIEAGPSSAAMEEALGRGLAKLHSCLSPHGQYGLDADNYIGLLNQPNAWQDSWVAFYRQRRLLPLAQLAEARGLLSAGRRERLFKLIEQLERWLPVRPAASLLHGDLWSGNWLAGADGRPYLIDPAVSYGDREHELAFTELFGGFSARFYAAYSEAAPLEPEYADRRSLYQLYYLLVHLIHFGERYGPSVDGVLQRYMG